MTVQLRALSSEVSSDLTEKQGALHTHIIQWMKSLYPPSLIPSIFIFMRTLYEVKLTLTAFLRALNPTHPFSWSSWISCLSAHQTKSSVLLNQTTFRQSRNPKISSLNIILEQQRDRSPPARLGNRPAAILASRQSGLLYLFLRIPLSIQQ